MSPRSGTGANTAERVPSTMRAWPLKASRQAPRRSWSVSPECSTASGAAKRSRKRPSSCGVRPISGTSTSARRPCASTRSIRRRYTSVLPLPVIPCSTKAAKRPSDVADRLDRRALLGQQLRSRRRGAAAAAARRDRDLGLAIQPRRGSARAASRHGAGMLVQDGGRGAACCCEQQREQRRAAVARGAARPRARAWAPAAGDDPALLARDGSGAEPQRLGQGARQHLPERVVVVLRGPLEESERGRIEQRRADRAPRESASAAQPAPRSSSAISMTTPTRRCRPNGTRTRDPRGTGCAAAVPPWAGSRTAAAAGCRAPPGKSGSMAGPDG